MGTTQDIRPKFETILPKEPLDKSLLSYSRRYIDKQLQEKDQTIDAQLSKIQELNEMISILKRRNENNLTETVEQLMALTELIQCEYPPYKVAQELRIPVKRVKHIAERIGISDAKGLVVRISRVNKRNPKKHETIVLYSKLAVGLMSYAMSTCQKNPEIDLELYKDLVKARYHYIKQTIFLNLHNSKDKKTDKTAEKLLYEHHRTWRKLAQ